MYKIIIVNLLLVALLFSACYKKIDNTSINDKYRILDEVSIVGISKNIEIIYNHRNVTNDKCSITSKLWLNQLTDTVKFSQILKNKNIEVVNLGKPVKRLIVIKPMVYKNTFNSFCKPNEIYTEVFLYDVENISKNWSSKTYENIINEIDLLKDDNIIYTNRYFSDADFNSFPVTDYNYFSYKFNQTTKEDVTKFFNIVIEDLERVVKFA
ncbi:hypothetical protein [Aliarcobacter cryaerophilus]|uniref:hypothetical protein n=1 Tax=Aliarcobacter cryaerophilus TaxID=28198 RepID=UPI003BAFE230